MPSQLDLAITDQMFTVQNQAQFSKLSVYFALNQIQRIPELELFGKLYGDKPWQPNMGPTMQGVRIEPTPRTRTFFRPNSIQNIAKKDVYDQRENQERASLYWHKFRSPSIYFLRSFQDFIADQIRPAMEDLNGQVVFGNEMFIQTGMMDRSPKIFYNKANGPALLNAPHNGPPNYTADPKSLGNGSAASAWMAAQIADMGGQAGLTFPFLDNLYICAKEDQAIMPFNGAANFYGKENDPFKANYVITTSGEAFMGLKYDPVFQKLRSVNTDYAFGGFNGRIFDDLIWRPNPRPIRFKKDGTPVAPEIQEDQTGESLPNPDYADPTVACVELGWFLGGDAYHTIKIGPPPKEFAGGASVNQVNGMNWNGKVRITDNILIQYIDPGAGSASQIDTNADKEYLQLRATLTMGILPGRPRNAIPFLFFRTRPNPNA